MKRKISFLLPGIFIIALFLSLLTTIYTYKTFLLLRDNELWSRQTNEISSQLDRILLDINIAEVDQHNYFLTADNFYLQSVNEKDIPEIKDSIAGLKLIAADNLIGKGVVANLEVRVNERIALFILAQQIYRSNGAEGIRLFYNEGQSIRKTNEITSLINSIKTQQNTKARQNNRYTDSQYPFLLSEYLVSSILGITLMILFYLVISRELRSRGREERLKDEFINMASHELKTPVTSLKIFIQVMEKKLDEGKVGEAKRYISKLDVQIKKLTLLISDLLDLSRIQTGKMQYEKVGFNLDALIEETVEEIQGTTKNHEIIAKLSVNRMVYADRYRIYQVLVNLLTNAVKYSPIGSKIYVTSNVEKSRIVVSVRDSGIGIDPKYQKKIFQRLYQVTEHREKTYPGLGIGLYVASNIMHEHKGQIWVESEPGKGSTFYFTLPVGE